MAPRPRIARTLPALHRALEGWRDAGESIALVPTMGALHEGHLSLVRLARKRAQRVVVSIFVNPAQFAPNEDFASYPRTFDADAKALTAAGVGLIWAPPVETMYTPGFATRIVPEGPAKVGLEDAFRPHFFGGVAIVVSKLLIQCLPNVAVFGEKDFQQLMVVARLAADLDLPVKIVGAPDITPHADIISAGGREKIDHGRVDIQVGTLSKAIGALGGYVAGSRALIDFLYHRARPFLFSTSHPPPVAAACIAAIDVLLEEPALIDRLWDNTRFFKAGLTQLGFNTGMSESPITPVIVGDAARAMALSDRLFARGVFAQGIGFPTVARDKARVRTIVTATHTREELQFALDAFAHVGRELGIIQG